MIPHGCVFSFNLDSLNLDRRNRQILYKYCNILLSYNKRHKHVRGIDRHRQRRQRRERNGRIERNKQRGERDKTTCKEGIEIGREQR